jgi:hypothetical protein
MLRGFFRGELMGFMQRKADSILLKQVRNSQLPKFCKSRSVFLFLPIYILKLSTQFLN